jgi:predicted O-methyltransferase YrrM
MTFDELLETARGFQASRALLTAVELDVFTALGEGATAPEAAARLGADPRATEMLLNALAALGVLTKEHGVFHNTPMAAEYLSDQSPESERAAVLHTAHLWDRWSALTRVVRTGKPVGRRRGAGARQWTQAFIAAMHRGARARAPHLVQAVGVEGVRRMLDVGGGSGALSIAFAQAAPELRAEVLDLPEVLPITRRHIRAAGLSGRVTTRPGDLTADAFGQGYDLALVSMICHMLSPEQNRDLFRRVFQALAPGGRIVVQDFILNPDKTAPRMAALFSLNMLTGTEAGASYSEPEYAAWLEEAGFREVRKIALPIPSALMAGVRPLT